MHICENKSKMFFYKKTIEFIGSEMDKIIKTTLTGIFLNSNSIFTDEQMNFSIVISIG